MAVPRNLSRLKTFEAVGVALGDVEAQIEALRKQAAEIAALRVERAGEAVMEVFPELTNGSYDGSLIEYFESLKADAEAYRKSKSQPTAPSRPAIDASSIPATMLDDE